MASEQLRDGRADFREVLRAGPFEYDIQLRRELRPEVGQTWILALDLLNLRIKEIQHRLDKQVSE